MPYEKVFLCAGVKFHDLHTILDQIEEGDGLDLVKEPTNKFDPNAIRIEWNGTMVGYVPKKFSAEISGMMDICIGLGAVVHKLDKKVEPWNQLTIKVIDFDPQPTEEEYNEDDEDR